MLTIVSLHEVILRIGVSDSATGTLTLQQANDYIQTNTVNDTDYYLYFSSGHYMAGCNFGGVVTSFWNISIHYVAEPSSDPVVLWTGEEKKEGIIHKGINSVTFKDVTLENASVIMQSCKAVSFESVSFVGKKTLHFGNNDSQLKLLFLGIGFTFISLLDTKGSFRNISSQST
jgi:hypothetical protein